MSEKQMTPDELKQSENHKKFIADLNVVLELPEGRRVFWQLMGHCKPFGSIWEASAKIHYNSGRQDVGHHILHMIIEADPQKYLLMTHESIASKGDDNG